MRFVSRMMATGLVLAGAGGGQALAGSGSDAFDLSQALIDVPKLEQIAVTPSNDALLKAIVTPVSDGPAPWAENWFGRIVTAQPDDYTGGTFWRQTRKIPLEIAAVAALPLYHGLDHWNWGKSSFHFTSEGWFGKDTHYLGVDKLGHAYTTYLYADFFTQRIAHRADSPAGAAMTGSLLAFGIMAGVEVGDGFSPDYGFSPEDLVSDGIGAGFAYLRNTVPGLAEKLDYRMEYVPSKYSSFDPTADYEGQKYLLALKLGGFERFEDSPLRFIELQAGYFARGVGDGAVAHGVKRRREPFVAIGFNLQQLINETPAYNTTAGLIADSVLEKIQLPYTYLASKQK